MRIEKDYCVITKSELRALAAHASTDETRAHINCVLVDYKKGVCVATDGHRMAIAKAHTAERADVQALLSLSAVQTIAKALRRAAHCARLTPQGDKWQVEIFDREPTALGDVLESWKPVSTFTFPQVDAQFPPYEQVLPPRDREHAPFVGVNPTYLADLELVRDATEGRNGVELSFGGVLDPILATVGCWSVAIMPMRI